MLIIDCQFSKSNWGHDSRVLEQYRYVTCWIDNQMMDSYRYSAGSNSTGIHIHIHIDWSIGCSTGTAKEHRQIRTKGVMPLLSQSPYAKEWLNWQFQNWIAMEWGTVQECWVGSVYRYDIGTRQHCIPWDEVCFGLPIIKLQVDCIVDVDCMSDVGSVSARAVQQLMDGEMVNQQLRASSSVLCCVLCDFMIDVVIDQGVPSCAQPSTANNSPNFW